MVSKLFIVLVLITSATTGKTEFTEDIKMVKYGRIWCKFPRMCYEVIGGKISRRPDLNEDNCRKVLERYLY